MANVFDICAFFIKEGLKEHPISHIKLQKLLYFAQGIHLGAFEGKPLFNNRIEAWKFGPVVPDVYHNKFKHFGNNPIRRDNLDIVLGIDFLDRVKRLDTDKLPFLNDIWETYKNFSPFELVQMTHVKGSPWYEIFETQGRPENVEITKDAMTQYFKKTFFPE